MPLLQSTNSKQQRNKRLQLYLILLRFSLISSLSMKRLLKVPWLFRHYPGGKHSIFTAFGVIGRLAMDLAPGVCRIFRPVTSS